MTRIPPLTGLKFRSFLHGHVVLGALLLAIASPVGAAEDYFASRVAPILEANCFECHSHAHTIKGGLALDSRSGLARGGEGGPILVPGKPEESRLITAVQHVDKEFQMPPKSKLSDVEIATLVQWITDGAVDTRPLTEAKVVADGAGWDALYRERKAWWSLQPIADVTPPDVGNSAWPRNEVDAFILASLGNAELAPVTEADPQALVRRLSFALTGLPPAPADVADFAANPTDAAYEALVHRYVDSPHFGERWARHWMDVVHYSDTHGYEWDAPAKHAWRYRDYLIRAYNKDVSYRQLVLEQIAGDLLPPRVDPDTGLNEAMIGPMSMRMGERRHGDNAAAEGVTQEAIANMIDTVSKGFLATTVACAQCHDHKLDAVAQRDYYSLAGVFMSSRWTVRSAEAEDPNGPVLEELAAIKGELKEALGAYWSEARSVVESHLATPPPEPKEDKKTSAKKDADPPEGVPFPENVVALRDHLLHQVAQGETVEAAWIALDARYREERATRVANNEKNLSLTADFTGESVPDGWRADGWGMKHGQVDHGALVVADEGDGVVSQLLPAGRWSHVWSKRLAGALRSELLPQDPPPTVALAYAGGDYAAQSLVVDNAFHSERMKFLKQPTTGWLTFTAGNHAALAGGPDNTPRLVYLEMVTKSLNNYYPPRDNYGGLKQAVEEDPRSWFGVTHAYDVAPGYTPVDELGHLEALFTGGAPPTTPGEVTARIGAAIMAAVEHWRVGTCDGDDVRLLNEALMAGWLPNTAAEHPALAAAVARYRETEARLRPERTVGSADDWYDGQNARIGIRGSYTALGEEVPRGTIRFLDAPGVEGVASGSGRLELAQHLARADNPLTARVYVNRIWHHLFGAGIVRTVDDFGHLGEQPSHPELLDWLAHRFVEEGWSTKKLITRLVTSATWRQGSVPTEAGVTADPENRLWHHMPLRRLEAEAIRDAMLAASGRLEPDLFGPPIDPYRVAEDSTKRLYAGPLDGLGRRSIYQKMTLMEMPRFLALFNQPIPMLTTGRRDTTNVPNQALAMLNDPFVMEMAATWSNTVVATAEDTVAARVNDMFTTAFARPPSAEETARFVDFASHCATLRGVPEEALLSSPPVWQDVAHAIFNLKEFIYVQ